MRAIVVGFIIVIITGCETTAFTKVQGNEFKVEVYDLEADPQAIIENELQKKGICKNGFEITSSNYFMYGCPVFGFLPADCRGKLYYGHCIERK